MAPGIGHIAGFLPKLAPGRPQGGFLRVFTVFLLDGAGGELCGDLPDALAELADAEEAAFLIRGADDRVVPPGIAVIGLEDPAVRETLGGFPEIDPFVPDNMLGGDFLPDQVFILHGGKPPFCNDGGTGVCRLHCIVEKAK